MTYFVQGVRCFFIIIIITTFLCTPRGWAAVELTPILRSLTRLLSVVVMENSPHCLQCGRLHPVGVYCLMKNNNKVTKKQKNT